MWFGFRAPRSCITFIPYFIKIDLLIQKLLREDRQRSIYTDIIYKSFFLYGEAKLAANQGVSTEEI
jgi:hypothetical protein